MSECTLFWSLRRDCWRTIPRDFAEIVPSTTGVVSAPVQPTTTTVIDRRYDTMTAISGNTYPVKDALKALGARWNPDRKVWMIADDKADQANQIVATAGPKKPYSPSRGSYSRRSRECPRCGCSECGGPCQGPSFDPCFDCR